MSAQTSLFGTALEVMDNFLSQNEENLIVQFTILLERKTGVNRYYVARLSLFLGLAYFLFSSSLITLLVQLGMFLYPSFRTYTLLKRGDEITKDELVYIVKYWVFVSFFTTIDHIFGILIPFSTLLKFWFIIQFALPSRSPGILTLYDEVVVPVYATMEKSERVQQLAGWLASLRCSNRELLGLRE